VAFNLVFVAMVRGDGGARECSDKEFTGEQRRAQKQLRGFNILNKNKVRDN
jgi:hypothetical protein